MADSASPEVAAPVAQDEPLVVLGDVELRVLGSLVEKQITTPEYYPLTLNALVNACNQTSSRDPVVNYDEPTVTLGLDRLREKKLAYVFAGAESRVLKFGHKLPERFELTAAELAVLCVLWLRGPQTPGEIRGRTARMHGFTSLAEVELTLDGLCSKKPYALVARLPRQTGLKETRYAHLFAGPVAPAVGEGGTPPAAPVDRTARLEQDVASLRNELSELRQQFADFRKQFE